MSRKIFHKYGIFSTRNENFQKTSAVIFLLKRYFLDCYFERGTSCPCLHRTSISQDLPPTFSKLHHYFKNFHFPIQFLTTIPLQDQPPQ